MYEARANLEGAEYDDVYEEEDADEDEGEDDEDESGEDAGS